LGKTWEPLAPGSWRAADDAFLRGAEACVVEHDASRLHHFDGTAWHASEAPISGPRSLWASDDALWIGGDGGAATLDNGAFRKLEGLAHVVQVLGRNAGDVWLCSRQGVFRARSGAR
jgi:hypothetical protein